MERRTLISVILPLKLEWEPCYWFIADDNICDKAVFSTDERLQEDGITTEDGGGTVKANGQIVIGDRIKVNFAGKFYLGVVSGIDIKTDIAPDKIRTAGSINKDIGRIYPQEIDFWRAVSSYYLCTVGEVYKAAYPEMKVAMEQARAASLRKSIEKAAKEKEMLQKRLDRISGFIAKQETLITRARTDKSRERYILAKEKYQMERIKLEAGIQSAVMTESGDAGEDIRPGITLSSAQSQAVEQIHCHFAKKKPVLLNGITGSGKTEIYITLACETLSLGKNVLYLVPEIALSRQLEQRLRKHFGDRLHVFHSGETAASRREVACSIRETSAENGGYITLGTRSALFLPHHDLGLIIVDEEHDTSYKQDSPAPKYNGRDAALMLAKVHGCDTLLGSATPSLEELYNCSYGRHCLVKLEQRYYDAPDADIEIIDTKAERRKRGMRGSFSLKLIDKIQNTLDGGGQVVILRARRSWATILQCSKCGRVQKCPHCNISLSLHKGYGTDKMVCHYCGWKTQYTGHCSACEGQLTPLGAGTQKIEEEAASLFPNARIARLDSDTARNRIYEREIINEFYQGGTDILIGTQIVTKGFDFGNLRLVAVIGADSMLSIQDFRADEKTVQILEQFRGRCGRRKEKGLFIIQTAQPEHPVYRQLAEGKSSGEYSMKLLSERKDFGFPPYTRIIEIQLKDSLQSRVCAMAAELSEMLRTAFRDSCTVENSSVTGPYAPIPDKIEDQWIQMIRISLKKDGKLKENKDKLMKTVSDFEKTRKYIGHISINVDPI